MKAKSVVRALLLAGLACYMAAIGAISLALDTLANVGPSVAPVAEFALGFVFVLVGLGLTFAASPEPHGPSRAGPEP